MTESNHAGPSSAPIETVAGIAAASIQQLAVHPIDVVKVRMQVDKSKGTSRGSVAVLKSLVKNKSLLRDREAVAALYRGLNVSVLASATSLGCFFYFKTRFEAGITSLMHPGPNGRAALTAGDYFVASGLAGATTQFLTNPLWVVKTRMMTTDGSAQGAYQSMWHGLKDTAQKEGIRGLYRGLFIGVLCTSHGAFQFALYEPLKRAYFARQRRPERSSSSSAGEPESLGATSDRISTLATVAISSVAKLGAGISTYPLTTVRARIQSHGADQQYGRGIVGTTANIVRQEGFRGFYKGLVPSSIRVLPATWVMFLVYENVKYYLPRWLP